MLIGVQKDIKFGIIIYDPREIIKLVNTPKDWEKVDDKFVQRPWKEKRVKEISKYVAGIAKLSEYSDKKSIGIIPNCPILSVKDPMKFTHINGVSGLSMPDSIEEVENCYGKVEILDGQHRLIAFSDEYRDTSFKDDEMYQMAFVVFGNLTLDEKREIFMISNDKQEKVENNLLNQFKKWLGLLSFEEEQISLLFEKLNAEDISLLKGRIIIGGHKVKRGLKVISLVKLFRDSKTFDLIKKLDSNQQVKVISTYLNAWNNIYNGALSNTKHTLSKISGLTFIFYLFPCIVEILTHQQLLLDEQNIQKVLDILYNDLNGSTLFDDERKIAFRAQSGIISTAKVFGEKLKETVLNKNNIFDPLRI